MITIGYELWNGKECGCCSSYYESECQYADEQQAIAGCVEIARAHDWLFDIKFISGIANTGELQLKIDKIVEAELEKSKAQAKA